MLADTLIVIGMATASLGTILEADGPVERTFWLCNSGREAVVLTQGYTSCGCTTLSFPKDSLIHPGDSAAVTLRFNPRGKGGDFEETATLTYGTVNSKSVNSKSVKSFPITFTVSPDMPKGLQHIPYPLKIDGKDVVITLDVIIK